MSKVALITGITGQDGAYLSEFLLKKEVPYSILIESIIYIKIRMSTIKSLFFIMET